MKNKFLTTVSLFALIGATPALAGEIIVQQESAADPASKGNIVDDAKVVVDKVKQNTADAYEDIKATLIGQESTDKNMPVVIDSRKTANGIIGRHVYNEKHESVATVTDIILDKDGKAIMIIVSDGAFIGVGKKAAFDYSAITRVENDGDVIMPLTQESIENAASFSYVKAKSGDKVSVIPDNGYSVVKLLDGQLVNQDKEPLADIENISFKNGAANQLIVGFDKTLGFGGDKAALLYNDTTILQDGSDVDFQLSASKALQFETFKETLKN